MSKIDYFGYNLEAFLNSGLCDFEHYRLIDKRDIIIFLLLIKFYLINQILFLFICYRHLEQAMKNKK